MLNKANLLDCYNVFNQYELDNSFTKNIIIDYDDQEKVLSYDEYILMCESLQSLTNDEFYELSQLEKIVKIYDVVKSKPYKRNDINPDVYDHRSLYGVLTNPYNYIVCTGYINVFNALLNNYGIKTTRYDYKYNDEKTNNVGGHSLSMVYVDDDKYDIHGLYFFDPTLDRFDKNLSSEKNSYHYEGFLLNYPKVVSNMYLNNQLLINDSFGTLFYNSNGSKVRDDAKARIKLGVSSAFKEINRSSEINPYDRNQINNYDNIIDLDILLNGDHSIYSKLNKDNLSYQDLCIIVDHNILIHMGPYINSLNDNYISLMANTHSFDNNPNATYYSVCSRCTFNKLLAKEKVDNYLNKKGRSI